jgi:general stress protein YciG
MAVPALRLQFAGHVEDPQMAISDRGFASMDPTRQREIASKGGRAAHERGTAHEWTQEEARAAGRKGGLSRHRPRALVSTQGPDAYNFDLEIEVPKKWT